MAGQRRLAIGAGLLALLLALLLVFTLWPRQQRRRQPAGQVAAPPAGDAPRPEPGARAGAVVKRLAELRFAAVNDDPDAPIIDEIVLEKAEVCRGEENLVSVRAHTRNHDDDALLHYMIVADTGASVPVRLQTRDDERTGVQRQILVFGKNNAMTSVFLPDYVVKDCDPERQLFIKARLLANTEGHFEFTAHIKDVAAAAPMRPVRWRWTFPDGEPVETEVPFAAHDFEARPQDTLYAQLLVKCEAIAADGETVVGRTAVQLLNPAFEEWSVKRLVRLSALMNPRFPELGPTGVVEQEVRIWHHRREPVRLTRVLVVMNPLPTSPSAARGPIVQEATPVSVLGTDVVPPGAGIRQKMRLDTTMFPELYSVDYLIEGVSAEGAQAHGNFSVMRPPPRPTRDNSQPVLSAYMRAKILRARELLGKEFVTDEDIWTLEREGKMADLREQDFPPPPPEPEPVRPPPGIAPRLPPAGAAQPSPSTR